ncbi:MAG: hypothetical protein CMQ40_00275 [Gammaproteobacteria bacterium]|nr:hypothetical protein [Gammaproteobacteria bacterium]
MSYSNLILTGGINHDFHAASQALKTELMKSGINSEIYSDLDEGFFQFRSRRFDLLTVFALRWRMLDHSKYEPYRTEWAYEIEKRDQEAILDHLNRGRGLLGLHTAAICFDTWKEWESILGVKWVWNKTFHPPPQKIRVLSTTQKHQVTQSLTDFEVTDEVYHNLRCIPQTIPLLYTLDGEGNKKQVLAWAHNELKGRVIYSSIAHDKHSIVSNGHSDFLRESALWCIGDKFEEQQ